MMKRTRYLLYIMTFLTDSALTLLTFTVTRHLAETHAGLATMGVAGGALALAMAVSSILAGRRSDHVGRRRLMAMGLVVQLLSAVCGMTAGDATWAAILCLGGVGFGSGLIYPPIIAWLCQVDDTNVDASRRPRRSISPVLIMFCLAWNVGMVFGQTLGGWLFGMGGTTGGATGGTTGGATFVAAGVIVVIHAVMLMLVGSSRQQRDTIEPAVTHDDVQRQTRSRMFARLAWLANLAGTFCMSMTFFLLPDRIVSLGITSQTHGLMLAGSRVVVIMTYLVMYRFSFWHHRLRTATATQVLGVVGMILLGTAVHQSLLIAGLLMMAVLVGYNYIASLYYSTSGSNAESRGAASGLHEATLASGYAIGSVGGGMIGQFSDQAAPYFAGALVIAVMAFAQVVLYARQPHFRPPASSRN